MSAADRSGRAFCPSVEDRRDQRWHLLELALAGGVPLGQALKHAALADAWLTGGVGNDRVLGLDMPFGKERDPAARPRADQGGGVVPFPAGDGS